MREGIRVIDADAHVMEPPDMWAKYIDPRYRSRAPRQERSRGQNWAQVLVDGEPIYRDYPPELVAAFHQEIVRDYGEYYERGFDAASQVEAMDRQGIDIAILYPSIGLGAIAIDGMDPALARAVAGAYNDWLHEFCSYAPTRLKPAALVSLHRTSDGVAELRRAVCELGMRAVTVRPNPISGRTLGHPDRDAFWAECEALEVAVGIHEGAHARLPAAGADRFTSHFGMHTCCHPLEQMMAMVALVEGGVFERHPGLRVGFLEAGCGWVPYWLWRMDELEYRRWHFQIPHVKRRPSEYFARQCYVSCEAGEPCLEATVQIIGSERLLFASDYPHPDHGFGEEIEEVLRSRVSESVKQQLLWENPARFYGIRLEAAA